MAKFVYAFGNLREIRIPGTLHQLGTFAISVTLWDTRHLPWTKTVAQVDLDPSSFDVLLTSSEPLDGVVVLLA